MTRVPMWIADLSPRALFELTYAGRTRGRRAGASPVASAVGAEDGWGSRAAGPAPDVNSTELWD